MTDHLAIAGWAALHLLWQGWLVWLVHRALLAVFEDARPRLRHACGVVALAGIVAAPLLVPVLALRAVSAPAETLLSAPAPAAGGWTGAIALLGFVWIAGAAVQVVRLIIELRALHRLQLRPAAGLDALVATLSRDMGLRRTPRVAASPDVLAPMVIGERRPTIVVPPDLCTVLPPAELRALLRHELAHVRRHDFAINLVQRLAMCIAWLQPASRLVAASIETERERCCDEAAAAAAGSSALSLARALVTLEERRAHASPLALAGTGGPLARRVRHLLRRPSRRPMIDLLGAAAAPALAVLVWGVAVVPAESGAAANFALLIRPLVTVSATDPAGAFTVQLVGGRARAVAIEDVPVPSHRLRQDGREVRVLDAEGRTALLLSVRADGAGIAWTPRGTSPP